MDVMSRARSWTPAAVTGDLEWTTAPQQRGQPGSSVYSGPGKKGRQRLISGLFPQPSSENDVGTDVDIKGRGTCRDMRRPPDLTEQRKTADGRRPGDPVLNASWTEHAEVVLWRHAAWRCELWIVNRTPRLRLYENETVVRDFGVTGAREALRLGDAWRTTVATGPVPEDDSPRVE